MENISPQEWETLSAYLDGQLSEQECARFEARLQASPELRSALRDYRHLRQLMQAVPRSPLPRNFTLTPDMVAKPGFKFPILVPVFSFASALSMILLVISLLFQGGLFAPSLASVASIKQVENYSIEPDKTEENPPQIIYWGDSPSMPLAGGYGGSGGGGDSLPEPVLEAPMQPAAAVPMEKEVARAAEDQTEMAPEAGIPLQEGLMEESLEQSALPTASTLPLPASPADMLPTQTAIAEGVEGAPIVPGQNTDPILGLPAQSEAGKMTVPTQPSNQKHGADQDLASSASDFVPLQISLAAIALLSAGIAAFFWRRSKT